MSLITNPKKSHQNPALRYPTQPFKSLTTIQSEGQDGKADIMRRQR